MNQIRDFSHLANAAQQEQPNLGSRDFSHLATESKPMKLELTGKKKDKQYPDTYLNQFSDYLGKKIPALKEFAENPEVEKYSTKIANMVEPTANAVLGAGDAVRNLMSAGYTSDKPSSSGTAYDIGKGVGDIGSFIGGGSLAHSLPGVSKIPEYLGHSGLGGIAQRLLGSEAFDILQNKDRAQGAKEGLQSGLVGEAIGAPFRAVGKAAEAFNPIKAAESAQQKIGQEAKKAKTAMNQAYGPVHEAYGNNLVTTTPEKYLGVGREDYKYFTPDVKKVYDSFIHEPNFKNLHDLQSQMGKDAARMHGNSNKIKTEQTLTNARNSTMDKISGFLSQDKKALKQYEEGKRIGREEYYPFMQGKHLTAVAEGRKTDLSPKQLISEITKAKEAEKLPENHILHSVLKNIKGKVNRGNAAQHALTAAAGISGLISGGPLGALAGAGSHFLSPHIVKLAQNPEFIRLLKGANTALRGTTNEIMTPKPMELEVTGKRRR